jgi:hypothetical protein
MLLVVASFCDLEKFCTFLDRVLRCDGTRTTSLHRQGDEKTSSLSDPKTAGDSRDIRGLHDFCDLPNQLCRLPDRPASSSSVVGLKKSSSGFGGLNAYVSNYKQIGHHSRLLYGDLLHSLDVTDSVTKSIDDLNVLDVRDGVLGDAKMFHVAPEALIMLLLDGLQSLSSGWMLVCTIEVSDEHGTQLVPDIDTSIRQIDKP